jgi:DNA repair exonuclease SbcCD nuclease subunit
VLLDGTVEPREAGVNRFRFLHAADLHLGSPFEGLAVKDREIAERFASATRTAFSELVRHAVEEKVAFVVIAGDVYDGEWRDNTIGLFFNREVAKLDRAGIPVFLLKGNHDADSVVTKSISLPASVRQFETRRPSSFVLDDLKVALHGQGFAERAAKDNLVLAYPPSVSNHFNIGVLHTSLTGRPPHADYAPCTVEELKGRGYDYWALGHVHTYEVVAQEPHIVFPGNLQGRNARETGEKGAVIVTVEDGRVAGLERVVVDQARFTTVELDISDCARLVDILVAAERGLAGMVDTASDRLTALRLRLTGKTSMRRDLVAIRATLADELQAACHRIHPDLWLEKLVLDLSDPADPVVVPNSGFDLAPIIDAILADPQAREAAEAMLNEIKAKMPGGLSAAEHPFGETLDTLLSEARDIALARAAAGGTSGAAS